MSRDPAIKTQQFGHQSDLYARTADVDVFALFWEMGLGKTKAILDHASRLYFLGKIRALLIVAQKSVYRNWITQEVPVHLAAPHAPLVYETGESRSIRGEIFDEYFVENPALDKLLRVVVMSYNNISLERGEKFASKLLERLPGMMVLDESTAIADPNTRVAKATKRVRAHASHAWIMTGTPVADGVMKIHSQMEFLDPDFWIPYGVADRSAFRNQFHNLHLVKEGRRYFYKPNAKNPNRNLDALNKIVSRYSSRLLKDDSEVKLPPKMYSVKTFEMHPEQRRVYDEVRSEFEAELDNGMQINATMGLTRVMRLQQITCGHVTAEDVVLDDELSLDPSLPIVKTVRHKVDIIPPDQNPRLELLRTLLDEASHKVIVWCYFKRDVDLICDLLGEDEGCLRYDGEVSDARRELGLRRFRDPADRAKVYVMNSRSVSHGLTMTIAKTTIYFSNHPSLEKRLQTEDRTHRIGQDVSVNIIDIQAERSVDQKIYNALKSKANIAAMVTGDKLREWLT